MPRPLEQRVGERRDRGVPGDDDQENKEHNHGEQQGQQQILVTGEEMTELREKPHAPLPGRPRRWLRPSTRFVTTDPRASALSAAQWRLEGKLSRLAVSTNADSTRPA